jgi:transglutaminase-like putative cysteine protease
MMNAIKNLEKNLLIYGVACWLLIEWLLPLETVSDTENAQVFIWFVSVCFLLYLLRIPVWLSAFIKIAYMVCALNTLFYHVSYLQVLKLLVQEIVAHIPILFSARWAELTNSFRSFLFFLLLWMMAYLLHYWLFTQKRLFFFYVLTVTYITVLDTFTIFRGNGAIIRLVVFGFFLLSLLHVERLREKASIAGGIRKWTVVCLCLIGLAFICGYFSPKLPPKWPDPVAFVRSYAAPQEEKRNDPALAKVKKIGYGQNDSRLGGPFIADDTVVFIAEDKKRHYWRVETKDIYTGKGWESSDSVQVKTFEENTDIGYSWWNPSVKKQTMTASIHIKEPYFHIVYPLGLKTIDTPEDIVFRLDTATEKMYATDRSAYAIMLRTYNITYEYPTFSIDKLNAAPPVQDEGLKKRYTQLPESVPKRVRDLAKQIVKGKQTQYEQVKAIEQYFHMNGYVYETNDVAIPGEKDDYVDQFLFETKKGYCDNFSTSMVVLLRSLGIPARWVKGYTSGQLIEGATLGEEEGKNVYQVTNKDAHSWVEVYFSGIGWVPFEPTQGFTNPYEFTDLQSTPETVPVPGQRRLEQNRVPIKDVMEQDRSSSSSVKETFASFLDIWSWKRIMIAVSILLACVLVLYKTRRKWWPYITLFLFKYKRGNDRFTKAYLSLLRHLDDYGLKRKQDQTLRQYAAYVDDWFQTKEMTKLTLLYEKAIYQQETVRVEWAEVKELWENLIKKTVS